MSIEAHKYDLDDSGITPQLVDAKSYPPIINLFATDEYYTALAQANTPEGLQTLSDLETGEKHGITAVLQAMKLANHPEISVYDAIAGTTSPIPGETRIPFFGRVDNYYDPSNQQSLLEGIDEIDGQNIRFGLVNVFHPGMESFHTTTVVAWTRTTNGRLVTARLDGSDAALMADVFQGTLTDNQRRDIYRQTPILLEKEAPESIRLKPKNSLAKRSY